jgi:uncharacterized membrane protein YjgN (DUF898 family)
MMTDALPPIAPPVTASGAEKIEFRYVKRPGLWKIAIINFLLGIITLGFYRFWAKTRVRQHIWSSVQLNNEPLEYTGTGMELFKGFLVVFFCLLMPFFVAITIAGLLQKQMFVVALQFIFFFLFSLFTGFAVYKSRHYQLSRTNWRGIRGALVGSAFIYSLLYFGSGFARSMSVGWATPVMNTVLQEQITNDMRFGDAAFKFKGRAGPLYPTYAMCWLLTLGAIILISVLFVSSAFLTDYVKQFTDPQFMDPQAVIGLIVIAAVILLLLSALFIPMLWAIYIAKQMRVFADYTRFDGVPFSLEASTWGIIKLTVVNILLIIVTLGIAVPITQQRTVKYIVDRLKLNGMVDIDRIRQSSAKMMTRGEGLADALDVGGL